MLSTARTGPLLEMSQSLAMGEMRAHTKTRCQKSPHLSQWLEETLLVS